MVEKYNNCLINLKPHYSNAQFYSFPIQERWEIRISDGIWINPQKLVETTLTKKELKANPEIVKEATDWLESLVAKKKAYKSPKGNSYALTGKAVQEWFSKRQEKEPKLRLGLKLIDKNLPTRLYGGITETEGFQLAPLRPVANLTLKDANNLYKPIQEALAGIGIVTTGRDGRIVVRAATPEPAYSIMKEIAENNNAPEPVRVAYPVFRRESTDVPQDFYSGLIEFYGMFVQGLISPSHRETVNVLLGKSPEEQAAYYVGIAAEGYSKYSESGGVPYAAYLASSAPNWVNDLPTHILGAPLANFQRNRKRAIKELNQKYGNPQGHRYTDEELAQQMNMPLAEYLSHKESNENWVKMRTVEELTWKDNGQERITHHLDPSKNHVRDMDAATDMLLAILDTGIDLNDVATTEECLLALTRNGGDTADLIELRDIPNSYKGKLVENYKERRKQTLEEE